MKINVPKTNKTLCLLANSKVGDLYGVKILNSLKNDFNISDLRLVGNGGERLEKQYGLKSIVNINDFREKVLHLWRYSTKNINNNKYSPAFLYQVQLRMNNNVLNLMKEHKTVESIAQVRPSCIVNLDNEHLATEMAKKFNGKKFSFKIIYLI